MTNKRTPWLLIWLLFMGCNSSGPPSIQTTSASTATLAERIAVLEQYVAFRRSYETLEFAIHYQNNSAGLTPGPSEWDIRVLAQVPATELANWIPAGAKPLAAPDTSWLHGVPTPHNRSEPSEWYEQGGVQVGIDRAQRIVAYRNCAY